MFKRSVLGSMLVLIVALIGFSLIATGCSSDSSNNDNNGTNPSDGPIILNGDILEDMTLTKDNEYLLRGGVFVGSRNPQDGVTLTIEPGTVIYGESATYGMLVVRRGSKIMAEGTAAEPIVFTSNKPVGTRAVGDWGGLILNGQATLNSGETAEGEGGTGTYGGTNDDDNSGVLKYVRVEFAGREISPDNELNGIAFQGVGRGTTVDYIQVHKNKDDGIEFFGGTAQVKHVYITGVHDDNFDWTDGWRGKAQFMICQQWAPGDGNRGIEADNNGEDNTAEPMSNPTFYNFTLIGDPEVGDADAGILLREGTRASLHNGIVMNFAYGFDIDHDQTWTNAEDGTLNVDHVYFYGNGSTVHADSDPWDALAWLQDAGRSNSFVDPQLTAPTSQSAPDYRPASGSPVLSGAATPPNDGFFTQVNYVGAMNASDNWIAGWTTHAAN